MRIVRGFDFYQDFYNEDGTLKLEEAIESIFNLNHMKATDFGVEITKESAPQRGRTDGFCKLFTTEGTSRYCRYCGLQECKRDIKRSALGYKYQIIQGLIYYIQFHNVDIRFILYPSTNYIDYIIIKENATLINDYRDILQTSLDEYSPSEGCKHCDFPIDSLEIHRINIPDALELSAMWTDIMQRCE